MLSGKTTEFKDRATAGFSIKSSSAITVDPQTAQV